jgi:hypothetical protein
MNQEATMTRSEMTYTKFEAFEEQLAHFYFLLHRRFNTNARLAKFWLAAAKEELQHHAMLRFCRERGCMADVDINANTMSDIEQLLDTVKGIVTDPDVSVHEAFYAALLMEASELEDVYERLTAGLEGDHPLLFEAVQANLRSHYSAFAEAAAAFSGDPSLARAFRSLGGMV